MYYRYNLLSHSIYLPAQFQSFLQTVLVIYKLFWNAQLPTFGLLTTVRSDRECTTLALWRERRKLGSKVFLLPTRTSRTGALFHSACPQCEFLQRRACHLAAKACDSPWVTAQGLYISGNRELACISKSPRFFMLSAAVFDRLIVHRGEVEPVALYTVTSLACKCNGIVLRAVDALHERANILHGKCHSHLNTPWIHYTSDR